MDKKTQIYASVALGILFLLLSLIYLTHSGATLPFFFPGHDISSTNLKIKDGVLTLLLSSLLFYFAWFKFNQKPLKYRFNKKYNPPENGGGIKKFE